MSTLTANELRLGNEMQANEIREVLTQVRQMKVLVNGIDERLTQALGRSPTAPALDARDAMRVERFGEVAHRHLSVIEENGEMTLGESLAIRRELYGDRVQSTANLFGTRDSGALFFRRTPYGKTRHDSDKIDLTEEGKRIAQLWRELRIATVSS
jgi:hypothetical protein